MLIDCGSMQYCSSSRNLKEVRDDINKSANQSGLDVIVLSHTDMDHIEGFCAPSLTKLDYDPKEIWVPINCHPSYQSLSTYKGMDPLLDCFERFMGIRSKVSSFVDYSYWTRSKDNCLREIQKRYPTSEIRYVHSFQKPRLFSRPGESLMIEILNPPPPSRYILRSLLDILPREILQEAGLSRDEIDLIKDRKREIPYGMTEEDWMLEYFSIKDQSRNDEQSEKERTSDKVVYPLPTDKEIDAIRKAGKVFVHGGRINSYDAKRLCKYLDKLFKDGLLSMYNIASAIHPVEYEANLNSIVLNITWQERKLLFTGDLVDWRLIKNRLSPVALLKVPHHGGKGDYLSDSQTLQRLIPTIPVRASPLAIFPTCATFSSGETCCHDRGNPPDPTKAWDILRNVGFHTINTTATLTEPNLYTDIYIIPHPIPVLYAEHNTAGFLTQEGNP